QHAGEIAALDIAAGHDLVEPREPRRREACGFGSHSCPPDSQHPAFATRSVIPGRPAHLRCATRQAHARVRREGRRARNPYSRGPWSWVPGLASGDPGMTINTPRPAGAALWTTRLDRGSPLPLSRQLASALRGAIAGGS